MPSESVRPSPELRARPGRAVLLAVLLAGLVVGLPAAAQADTTPAGARADGPTPERMRAVLGTESLPPDPYLDPNVLKPFVNLETESLLAGLPVRQHPVNEGLFGTGCAQCHRVAGPLANASGAPQDVFDRLPVQPATTPPPVGFVRVTDDEAREDMPSWSPDGRRILYERRDDAGRWALWLVESDGTGARPLVAAGGAGDAGWAEWSPDGRRIAYWAEDGAGRGNVWLVNADGGTPRRLTDALATAFPVWSPDGRRIAYQEKDGGGAWSLRLLDPEAGTSRRIAPADQRMPSRPQFSPDGRRIAYQVADQGEFGLWRLEFPAAADGSPDYAAPPRAFPGSTLLPIDIGLARNSGIWSPDGERLALQMLSLVETPRGELRLTYKTWLTDPDGDRAVLLTPEETYADRSPSWSPDGRWVAQWSWNHDLTAAVWLASPDPSGEAVELTAALGGDALYPAWSPDGTRIAFTSNREGSFDIWVVDVAVAQGRSR